jgi:hypothetical protein
MSTGNYPFPTLTGTNVLDQIIAPKIVWTGISGYDVQADLGNIDTIYSRNIGSGTHPIEQVFATRIGAPVGQRVSNLYVETIGITASKVSNLYVETIGGTGSSGRLGARVSDIYVDTLHYLKLDPIVTGGTGTVIGVGNTGATGPQGVTGATGLTGIGVSGTTLSNGNLIFTYTNGLTANVGYIQGPTGNTPTIVVAGTNTLQPGIPAYVQQSNTSSGISLVFGIPQGLQGPRGPAGGSGGTGGSFSGTTGQILFYGGSDGITSSSLLSYNSKLSSLSIPTTTVKDLVNDTFDNLRFATDANSSYIQTYDPANTSSQLIISGLNGNDPITYFDTQNKRVSINKVLDVPTAGIQATLDIQGQTQVTFNGTTASTQSIATPYTAVTGSVFLASIPSTSYRIYAWGQGGTGPNALAGQEIEFNLTGGATLSWQYGGGASGAFKGGDALFINYNGQTAVAGGGGGGFNPANPGDPTAGQNAGSTGGGQGGEQTLGITGSPLIYSLPSGTPINSNFNNATLSGITSITFSGTTRIDVYNDGIVTSGGPVLIAPDGSPIPVTNGPTAGTWQYVQIKPNTTCNITTSSAILNASIGLPQTLGGTGGINFLNSSGFYLNAGSSGSPGNITLSSSIGSTGAGLTAINGNGLASPGPTITSISGSSVNLYGVTGFPSQQIVLNNSGVLNGGLITCGSTGGYMYFSSNQVFDQNPSVGPDYVIVNQPSSAIFTNFSNRIFASGTITASLLTIPAGQTGFISVQGIGGRIYASSGTSRQGGQGLNGGGGGGGLFGGGGGNNNIGGNGSSTGPNGTIINNSSGIYAYKNKYNNGIYGYPRTNGYLIIETNNQNSTQQPALIINGNQIINGNETITGNQIINGNETITGSLNIGGTGINLTVPILTTQQLQILSCSSLTTAGTADIAGSLTVQNGGMTIKNGDFSVNSGAITASGNITAFSDIRIKENIQNIDSALDKIMKLRGVYYTKKGEENPKRKIGVIAQEVEEILPEVVFTDESSNKNKSVDYGNIIALLIEGIKEQKEMIENLKVQKHLF